MNPSHAKKITHHRWHLFSGLQIRVLTLTTHELKYMILPWFFSEFWISPMVFAGLVLEHYLELNKFPDILT